MGATPTLPTDQPRAKAPAPFPVARLFYPGVAVILVVAMVAGFQQYYLRGRAYPDREIAPPVRTLVVTHAATMSAWVLLVLVQTLLILVRRRKLHQILGRLGAVLAAAIVVLGLKVGIEATRITPPEAVIWGLNPRQFMAVPVISIVLFGAFVAVGVWNWRRPPVHRAMMLMASLAAIPAAVSRIDLVSGLYAGTAWESAFGPFFGTLAVAGLLMLVKWALTRSFDWWYALGYAILIATSAGIMRIATTPAWDRFAGMLLGDRPA